MTFQEAVAERDKWRVVWVETGSDIARSRYADAANRVDQMLSTMSREMDMEKFDKETESKEELAG